MAHSTLFLHNDGLVKECPVGFSWTTLLFGGFPALIRGHILMGVVQIILQMLTFYISAIVFAFVYNKMYINYHLEKGYRPYSVNGKSSKELIETDFGIKFPES